MFLNAIRKVIDGADLTRDEARGVMQAIMSGDPTPAQVACYLVA